MGKLLPKSSHRRDLTAVEIGGKGLGLYRLAKLSRRYGYKVPDFFIVPADYDGLEGNITLRARYLEGKGNYAVRSSSPLEDSQEHSFAGIFHTELDVKREDLVDAVRKVKQSATSTKAQDYAQKHEIQIGDKMAVIVQRMTKSDLGGVAYSTLSGYPLAASVEYCEGSPRGVVDGTASSVKIVDFDKETLNEIFENEEPLHAQHETLFKVGYKTRGKDLRFIAQLSQTLEKQFGHPLDIEFAWHYKSGGHLHLLQARQITDIQPLSDIQLPKILRKDLLFRAETVRGIGEYEGPAVVDLINPSDRHMANFSAGHLKELDATYRDGYILFVPHYGGFFVNFDEVTPHKKAIVEFGFRARSSHALTTARENGILYMGRGFYGNEDFDKKEGRIARRIKNGERVKIVLNGRNGVVFKLR